MACEFTAQIKFSKYIYISCIRRLFLFPWYHQERWHANRNQLRMGSVLGLSQIISNCIIYCLRLYPYALCVALLFTYIIFIYFCMLYIFLGWCSPSMWPLVLYLIQNWLFIAKYFPIILRPQFPCPKVVFIEKSY